MYLKHKGFRTIAGGILTVSPITLTSLQDPVRAVSVPGSIAMAPLDDVSGSCRLLR